MFSENEKSNIIIIIIKIYQSQKGISYINFMSHSPNWLVNEIGKKISEFVNKENWFPILETGK